MSVIQTDPGGLASVLSDPRAWVVVLGDGQLASSFDGFATGALDGVVLVPNTPDVRAQLDGRNRGRFTIDGGTRAVALSASSGQVVDVLADEAVDNVRIVQVITRAESE